MVTDLYLSLDVETDGPIPGPHSMLSIGIVACLPDRGVVGTWSANLELLPNAAPDPFTADWWARQGDAYEKTRVDPIAPATALSGLGTWIQTIAAEVADAEQPVRPLIVAYPAGFDFTFFYWYAQYFRHQLTNPAILGIGFACIDVKTLAWAMLRRTSDVRFRAVDKKRLIDFLPPDKPHTHVAVEDAEEQAHLFLSVLAKIEEEKLSR